MYIKGCVKEFRGWCLGWAAVVTSKLTATAGMEGNHTRTGTAMCKREEASQPLGQEMKEKESTFGQNGAAPRLAALSQGLGLTGEERDWVLGASRHNASSMLTSGRGYPPNISGPGNRVTAFPSPHSKIQNRKNQK